MRVLGIEGTAWAASAAVYDTDTGEVSIETDPFQPESGGIDPGEAAEHMREAIPRVIDRTLENHAGDGGVDVVAFSRGPGLGPCLRIAGTAARALAGTLDVPLAGVNHMLAHCEIGRHGAGFDRPVCLNASGANAHVLGFHGGRYRVLGETTDVGVGNAIDKFTRHLGWSHPGGPKVEKRAKDGEYVELPYVVKGMDFSFSGIMSAAKQAVDEGIPASGGSSDPSDGAPVEDVCYSLQENVFAMLTEVSERALSLTGSDELVLGGGVGQNARLREMLAAMCEQRGADFYAPDPRFLRDNAGMIAVLGARMYEAGDTLAIEESRVLPGYRPDDVEVTWRSGESVTRVGSGTEDGGSGATAAHGETAGDDGTWTVRGAEAVVTVDPAAGRVEKRRRPKEYRHPDLDARLRRDRTVLEARLTGQARREGVPTPVLFEVDPREGVLVFEYVGDRDLRGLIQADPDAAVDSVRTVGEHLAAIHDAGFVHGDPTPRNVRVDGDRTYLVDFGLGFHTTTVEDYAMDLHVFAGSLGGTAADPDPLRDAFLAGYRAAGAQSEDVIEQLDAVKQRGRYREQS